MPVNRANEKLLNNFNRHWVFWPIIDLRKIIVHGGSVSR